MWFLQWGCKHWIISGGYVGEHIRCHTHSPPLHPLWLVSIWKDCTFLPGNDPFDSVCVRRNSAMKNKRSAVKYVTKKWKGAHHQESTVKVSCSPHTAVMIGTPSSFQLRMNSRSSSIFTCWMSLLKFSSVVPVQWKFKQFYYYYCKWLLRWKEYAAYLQGWKCRAAQLWSCLGYCRGGAAQAARSSWDPSPLHRPHPSPLPGPAWRHSFRWFKGKLG